MSVEFKMFRKKFFEMLEKKTGWGKEELKKMFDNTYFECQENETIN